MRPSDINANDDRIRLAFFPVDDDEVLVSTAALLLSFVFVVATTTAGTSSIASSISGTSMSIVEVDVVVVEILASRIGDVRCGDTLPTRAAAALFLCDAGDDGGSVASAIGDDDDGDEFLLVRKNVTMLSATESLRDFSTKTLDDDGEEDGCCCDASDDDDESIIDGDSGAASVRRLAAFSARVTSSLEVAAGSETERGDADGERGDGPSSFGVVEPAVACGVSRIHAARPLIALIQSSRFASFSPNSVRTLCSLSRSVKQKPRDLCSFTSTTTPDRSRFARLFIHGWQHNK